MPITARLLVPTLLAAAASAPLAAADNASTDYWVRAMPSLWLPQLGGDAAYHRGTASPATTVSADQLGLGDRQRSPQIEAGAQIPFLFGFHAGWSTFKSEGDSTLGGSLTFGTRTFAPATTVHAEAELSDLWGEICVRPLNLDLVGFSIGLAGHELGAKIKLTDSSSGATESFDQSVFVPAGSLRAHVTPLTGLTIEGRLHYMEIGLDGDHIRFAQAEFQASYCPIRWVGVLAGYRYDLYDVHLHQPNGANSSADANLHLSGPYVGLMAKF
jgi:hypothetical protein